MSEQLKITDGDQSNMVQVDENGNIKTLVNLTITGEIETLRPEAGDLIVVKIIGNEDITQASLDGLKKTLNTLLPNNRALVLNLPTGDVSISVIKQAQLQDSLDEDHTLS